MKADFPTGTSVTLAATKPLKAQHGWDITEPHPQDCEPKKLLKILSRSWGSGALDSAASWWLLWQVLCDQRLRAGQDPSFHQPKGCHTERDDTKAPRCYWCSLL